MNEEEISLDELKIKLLDHTPIGEEIATAVADKIIQDKGRDGIWYCHRDYCGHGLVYMDDCICLVEVYDGYAHEGSVLKKWDIKTEFIDWLAVQSDYSLSGSEQSERELHTINKWRLNNQRLTRARFLDYLSRGNRYY